MLKWSIMMCLRCFYSLVILGGETSKNHHDVRNMGLGKFLCVPMCFGKFYEFIFIEIEDGCY